MGEQSNIAGKTGGYEKNVPLGGKGKGMAMLKALERQAKDSGWNSIIIVNSTANVGPRRPRPTEFYQNHG